MIYDDLNHKIILLFLGYPIKIRGIDSLCDTLDNGISSNGGGRIIISDVGCGVDKNLNKDIINKVKGICTCGSVLDDIVHSTVNCDYVFCNRNGGCI